MSRRHGVTEAAYQKFIIDSGQVRVNYVDESNPGMVLGATRDGAVFAVEPEIRQMPVDGAKGDIEGDKRIAKINCFIQAGVIEFASWMIKLAAPGATAEDSGNHVLMKRALSLLLTAENSSVALVGQVSGTDEPFIGIIKNGIADNNLEINFTENDESKLVMKIVGRFDPDAADAEPWEVFIPQTSESEPPEPPNPGIYVGIDDYLNIRMSSDLVNWTWITDDYYWSISYGNGRYVANKGNVSAFVSLNGYDWTAYAFPIPEGSLVQWIKFVNGKFYAGYDDGSKFNLLVSSDGITWSAHGSGIVYGSRYPGVDFYFMDMAYGNGIFLASTETRSDPWTGKRTLWKSIDGGLTWSFVFDDSNIYGNFQLYFFAKVGKFFHNLMLSSDIRPGIRSSSDGLTWTVCYVAPDDPNTSGQRCFAEKPDEYMLVYQDFVGGTKGDDILKTSDGEIWSKFSTNQYVGPQDLIWDESRFILVGDYDSGRYPVENLKCCILCSATGESWSYVEPVPPFNQYRIIQMVY